MRDALIKSREAGKTARYTVEAEQDRNRIKAADKVVEKVNDLVHVLPPGARETAAHVLENRTVYSVAAKIGISRAKAILVRIFQAIAR